MNFLKALSEFEINVTGGFAVYVVLCVGLVTVGGLYNVFKLD